MNDRNSSKYNMYVATIRFCQAESAVWSEIPAYHRALVRLEEIVQTLNTHNVNLQGGSFQASEKSTKRKQMENLAELVGGAVRAFASATGNESLRAEASVSLKLIDKAKESDADDIALHLHRLGTQYLTEAADFGLKQQDLDNLKSCISSFNETLSKPKMSIAESKATREQMDLLFKEADKILNDQLDNMSLRFATTRPDYYSRYQSARNIVYRAAVQKESALPA